MDSEASSQDNNPGKTQRNKSTLTWSVDSMSSQSKPKQALLVEICELILNFICKGKGIRTSKTILKKKVGGISLCNSKTFYTVTVIKIM